MAAALAVAAVAGGGAVVAGAESIEGLVKNPEGKPITDAVISAVVVSGSRPSTQAGRAIVDQQDKEFVPHVRPILVGTEVTFPNRDDIRHHVYSFSPAKKFELPLFKGTQTPPVKFDKVGIVVLGCNIHDWMLGYLYVLETPYFDTTTANGRARLAGIPPGTYEVQVWHPRLLEGGEPSTQRVELLAGKEARIEFVMSLKPDLRPRRAPARPADRYR